MSDGKRRVLWVIKGLGPGGAERLLCAAAKAHDHRRLHIECAFVLPWKDHLAEELEQAGVRTHCVSKRRVDRLWPLKLARLVRGGNWDVVHVHSPLPGSVARLATRTMASNTRPILMSTEHNRWSTHRLPTRILNRLTSRWDAVSFAVSDEVHQSMAGPVRAHTETLRHGIDVVATAKEITRRIEIRDELGIGHDEFVVGTVANYRPQKDYPNLFQAARLLADRDVPVKIVAVGQGPQEVEIHQLRMDLGLEDRVILTGFRNDAVRVMGACDAFTLASQWEGLPVAIMEALALGLPIVATAVGGVAEQLTDGVDALFVPPRDPEALASEIARVAADGVLRSVLAARSTERAAEFDVHRAVNRIETAYKISTVSAGVPSGPMPVGRKPLTGGLDIRPATPDDRPAIMELCRASLGWSDDPRFEQLFSWKHDQNAFGPSYMWVATDRNRVVGVRPFMRWEFERGAEVLHAVRAVDTATHPDYQGRGLFTALTTHALDEVRDVGVDFVFNTPNDQSRPGYLKMGWKTVGRIPVSVRPARFHHIPKMIRSRVAASHWPLDFRFGLDLCDVVDSLALCLDQSRDPEVLKTRTSAPFLSWRYGADVLGYRVLRHEDGYLFVRLRQRGAGNEFVVLGSIGLSARQITDAATMCARRVKATHILRAGHYAAASGFVPALGYGPILTWHGLNQLAKPHATNWNFDLGDIEIF